MVVRLLAALAILACVPSVAFAEDDAQAKARVLFSEGTTRMDAGDFEGALSRFRSAYELLPNTKILLNIATMLRELGRNAEAADAYAKYIDDPNADAARRKEVQVILDELDKKLGKLRIEIDQPRVRVLVDEKPRGEHTEAFTLRVTPGEHAIVGEADGTELDKIVVSVAANEEKSIKLSAKATAPKGKPASRSHHRQLGIRARMDIEGRARGVAGVVGATYAPTGYLEVSASAIIGGTFGVEPGVTVFFLTGPLKPTLGVTAPIFFRNGPYVGVRPAIGIQWDPGRNFGAFAQFAMAFFPRAPAGYDKVVILPAVGAQVRFF